VTERRHFILILVGALGSACVGTPATREPAFVRPDAFIGRSARVCGYMIDSANIVESPHREEWDRRGGLSIKERGPVDPFYRGRLCVEGSISFMGCETGPVICTDAAFDYAITITRRLDTGHSADVRTPATEEASRTQRNSNPEQQTLERRQRPR